MQSVTSFTSPPHYPLHDAETAEYVYVKPASNKLGWLVACAAATCVLVGVVAWVPFSQPQVLYTPQATTVRPTTVAPAMPVNNVAAPVQPVAQVADAPLRQAQVAATTAAVTMAPLAAQAAVTSSLKNLLGSVVAGGVVLGAIAGAVVLVSQFDKVDRT
jgi:hypothetical protein